MAVIELAKPGQEAITYELIVSVANAALTVTVVLATQLLTPFDSVTCTEGGSDDDGTCPNDQARISGLLGRAPRTNSGCPCERAARRGLIRPFLAPPTPPPGRWFARPTATRCLPVAQVNVYSIKTYKQSNGPERFTKYSLVCLGIGLASLLLVTPFLPRTKAECAAWKAHGESGKFALSRTATGWLSAAIAFAMVGYVTAASVAILNPATACLAAFGGGGC